MIRRVWKKRVRAIAKTSSIAQAFYSRKRVKLERERRKKELLRSRTKEEDRASLPGWIKPAIKAEKSPQEALEKVSENQDNMNNKSALGMVI